jgi:hypothetical protein
MSLRQYFRLLRPFRSLRFLLLAGFLLVPFSLINREQRGSGAALCVVLFLWLALGLGLWLANAAHEMMHQPWFMVLPGGLRGIRRLTITGVLLSAAALAGLAVLAGSPFSPWAAFGLAAALLALPLTSRHLPANLTWPLCFVLIWGGLFFCAFRGWLPRAMMAAPAAFLLGGLLVAAAAIARGFSRAHLRQRASTALRRLDDAGDAQVIPGLSREQLRQMPESARRMRGWSVSIRPVTGSIWSWMRVLALGNPVYAAKSWWAMVGGMCLLMHLAYPFLEHFRDVWPPGGFDAARYWARLAGMAAVEPTGKGSSLIFFSLMLASASLTLVRPALAFPLSRVRLARAVFGLTLVQWAVPWSLVILMGWLTSLLGQAMAGSFLPGGGLPVMAAQYGAPAVLLLLILCLTAEKPALALGAAGPGRSLEQGLVFGLVFALFSGLDSSRHHWLPVALTPLGAAVIVVFGVGGVALLWRCVHRHYRGCDLIAPPKAMPPGRGGITFRWGRAAKP